MLHRIRTYLFALGLFCTSALQAQTLSDEARISLLTCAPGEELYARFGHTALRVTDPAHHLDAVFNYGVFDFNTDHFYWKFVRGETWYELGASPYRWFMQEYIETKRPVYEQVLNLTAAQRDSLWEALLVNYEPQNRSYLYNFVFDNCATRPYHMLIKTIGDSITSTYTGWTGVSYRAFIRHYTGRFSWSNAGINLLFGPKADHAMSSEQRLFLPEELMYYLDAAYTPDNTPVVSLGTIAPFAIDATPWYFGWPVGLFFYLIAIAGISCYDRRRGKWSKWPEIAAGSIYGLLLLIVFFLTFFSCHPLVGFGWRLFIIPVTHLCARLIYIIRW